MSCSPSAAEMGNCGELDVEKAIEAIEESLENLQCLDRVNINSMNRLYDDYNKLSQSYNEEFEKLTNNAIEEVKKTDKNAEESIRKLAEDLKKQDENLERRIFEMRKELDAAELESVEQHKRAFNNLKLIKESEEIKALRKIKDLAEECKYLIELNQTLKLKASKSNEELHETRKALLERAYAIIPEPIYDTVGWKNIGELDFTPFKEAMEKKYNYEEGQNEAYIFAKPLYEIWEENIQDPDWHPFKVVNVDGQPKEIIDEDDEKLKNLKKDYGEEVFNAVTTALTQRMQHSPVQRRPVEDLWNYEQNRLATVGEGVAYLCEMLDDDPIYYPISRVREMLIDLPEILEDDTT